MADTQTRGQKKRHMKGAPQPKNVGPKNFLRHKTKFWTQNCLRHRKKFQTPNFFRPNIFWDPEFIPSLTNF